MCGSTGWPTSRPAHRPSSLPLVSGSSASAPTVSVSFSNFAGQSVESVIPERTEFWMFTVCAASPPNEQWSQTTSVGGCVERPAWLMNRFELISRSPGRPQSMRTFRNVIRSPPSTCTPSWWRPGAFAMQRTKPPSISRSWTPSATLTPSPADCVTSIRPIRPVQPGRRWIASAVLRVAPAAGVIVIRTSARSTGFRHVHMWSTRTIEPVGGDVVVAVAVVSIVPVGPASSEPPPQPARTSTDAAASAATPVLRDTPPRLAAPVRQDADPVSRLRAAARADPVPARDRVDGRRPDREHLPRVTRRAERRVGDARADRVLDADRVRRPAAEGAAVADDVGRGRQRLPGLTDEEVRVHERVPGAAAVDAEVPQRDPLAAHHLHAVLVQVRRLRQAAHGPAEHGQVVHALRHLDPVGRGRRDDDAADLAGAAGLQADRVGGAAVGARRGAHRHGDGADVHRPV